MGMFCIQIWSSGKIPGQGTKTSNSKKGHDLGKIIQESVLKRLALGENFEKYQPAED